MILMTVARAVIRKNTGKKKLDFGRRRKKFCPAAPAKLIVRIRSLAYGQKSLIDNFPADKRNLIIIYAGQGGGMEIYYE